MGGPHRGHTEKAGGLLEAPTARLLWPDLQFSRRAETQYLAIRVKQVLQCGQSLLWPTQQAHQLACALVPQSKNADGNSCPELPGDHFGFQILPQGDHSHISSQGCPRKSFLLKPCPGPADPMILILHPQGLGPLALLPGFKLN